MKDWSPGGGLSGATAPGGGPKYTHASKERRGRQKERRTKKERVRHVEKDTKGFEHASGQRPGELFEIDIILVKILIILQRST